jgi:ArsR family transcriptional regulator
MREDRDVDVDLRVAEEILRVRHVAGNRLLREDPFELLGQPVGGLVDVVLRDRIERLRHSGPPSISTRIDVSERPDDDEDIDVCQYQSMETIATIAVTCPPLLQEPLEAKEADQLASALKALAEPARLRLLSLIQAQPGHEACVCHLTEPLGLSQPTVSHHLKVLLQAGLVEREQRGSWAYFRVREEPLAALRAVLS